MTLIGTAVQSVFTESSEDFAHMGLVLFRVVRINENVIKVNGDINVEKVAKNVIHKSLKGSGSISKSERHNKPFKGPVTGTERSLPFIAFSDMDKTISVPEVKCRVNMGLASSSKEIGNKRKRITILFRKDRKSVV